MTRGFTEGIFQQNLTRVISLAFSTHKREKKFSSAVTVCEALWGERFNSLLFTITQVFRISLLHEKKVIEMSVHTEINSNVL